MATLTHLYKKPTQQDWSSVGSGATTQHQGRDSCLPQSETDKNILSSTFRAKALRLES